MSLSVSRSLPVNLSLAKGKEYHQGTAAALLTTLMWASWLISVKLGSQSELTTFDLAIIRYGMPGLFFAYFAFRARHQIKKVSWVILLGICFGAGVPFFFLGSAGMHYAPVSHAGLLLPGTFPFFVTGIAVLFYREPISKSRSIGLIAIALGVIVLLAQSFINTSDENVWKGDLILLLASFFWAVFSVCVRVSGLSSFVVTGLFGSVSTIILLFMFFTGIVNTGVDFSLSTSSLNYYLVQFTIQGILVGLIASISFSYAITKIGAENTAAIGSLTPINVIVLAFFIFSEVPTHWDLCAIALVCFGVLKASEVTFFKKNLTHH